MKRGWEEEGEGRKQTQGAKRRSNPAEILGFNITAARVFYGLLHFKCGGLFLLKKLYVVCVLPPHLTV